MSVSRPPEAIAQEGPRTLRRGLQVLRVLRDAAAPDGLRITDLARQTGLQRPTLYRLLAALIEAGLVRQVPRMRRYQAVAAAGSAGSQDRRIACMRPLMQELAERTGDAVFLVVRDGDDSLSLHREIGGYPVQILATYAGKRQPLGVGSGSMALLAALPPPQAEQIVQRNAARLQEYGGMTVTEMLRLIENTRARGYAVVGNHAVRGALGVGCAQLDAQGRPLLAISVTAIIERMPAARQREMAALIQDGLARYRALAA
ncbi:IclR family transcriptional regulator [Orrella sp. JC864]|uniref:IclR family transcriptional regulator n=1 Tax=Orrella sp. JC864 TaxID=3120298 RepID=UPI0030096EBC